MASRCKNRQRVIVDLVQTTVEKLARDFPTDFVKQHQDEITQAKQNTIDKVMLYIDEVSDIENYAARAFLENLGTCLTENYGMNQYREVNIDGEEYEDCSAFPSTEDLVIHFQESHREIASRKKEIARIKKIINKSFTNYEFKIFSMRFKESMPIKMIADSLRKDPHDISQTIYVIKGKIERIERKVISNRGP